MRLDILWVIAYRYSEKYDPANTLEGQFYAIGTIGNSADEAIEAFKKTYVNTEVIQNFEITSVKSYSIFIKEDEK